MATVICPKCGSEVRGKFCTNCGSAVEAAPEQAGSDAGATTVIRSEDIQRMAEAGQQESPVPPADTGPPASTPPWTQPQDPAAAQTGQWQSPTPQGQPVTPPPADQQWQSPTPQGGQGWQQPPPQQPPPPTGWSGGGQQPGEAPPPQGSGYYAQQLGVPSAGTGFSTGGPTAPSMEIGALVRGAYDILVSRMQTVLPLVGVFAVIYAVEQIISLPGHGLQIIGLLIGAAAYAFIEAGMIFVTRSATAGETVSFQDVLPQIVAVFPRLVGAVIVAYIAIVVGLIGIIIGAFVVFTFLIFVPQAVVLDGASVFGSLGESWRMVATNFFGILGRWLVAILVLIVPAIIAGIIAAIVGRVPIVNFLITGFVDGILLSYFMAYSTLMFLSMKGRLGMVPTTGTATGYTGI